MNRIQLEQLKLDDEVTILETIVAGYTGKNGVVKGIHKYNDGKQVTRIEVLFNDGKRLFLPYFNIAILGGF